MDAKPVKRRLAAILAADVAGYSRLMGADEVGTFRSVPIACAIVPGFAPRRRDGALGCFDGR